MVDDIRIGIDTSKHVFQVHGGERGGATDVAQDATARANGTLLRGIGADGDRAGGLWGGASLGAGAAGPWA